MLHIHAVPAFNDNYIWLVQAEHSNNVLIVDPGDAEPVRHFLERTQMQPKAILITHHHADHMGGAKSLGDEFDIPVYGPADEQIAALTHPLASPCLLNIHPDFPTFEVFFTPGHTKGHISYLAENNLFCGDTLFAGGCGRLLGGTAEQLFNSLQFIKTLAPSTNIYCAHEYTEANLGFARSVEPNNPDLRQRIIETKSQRTLAQATVPSVLKEELATNPFLRTEQPEIKKAAEQYSGRPLEDELAVFTALRSWKDAY